MQRLPTSQIKLAARPLTARLFHNTARTCRLPRDNQDPTVVSPRTDENTRSGTDDEVAGLSDASYCRDNTKPEDELVSAGRESPGKVNPLEVSGANKDSAWDHEG
ncbi:hypothetical protein K4F52_007775 [Lecanicillium sp. MT-2017a]|nr:hypothetical protein K4F52_007775 [Lecanicillium sp. MT-2017a]